MVTFESLFRLIDMSMKKKLSKPEAIAASEEFLKEVTKLQGKYGVSFNSDEGDIYLSFKSSEKDKVWDTIDIGWEGDGTGLKVTEIIKDAAYLKEQALAKLSPEERKSLGV